MKNNKLNSIVILVCSLVFLIDLSGQKGNSITNSLQIIQFVQESGGEIVTSQQQPDEQIIENEFTIEFSETRLAYNDHVGNEWVCYSIIDGEKLLRSESKKVILYPKQKINITCYLQETEEKYNDKAEESFEITYSDLVKYKNDGFYIAVTVKESNGRYAGNTAKMEFHFNIK